jgi:hypothetical protein
LNLRPGHPQAIKSIVETYIQNGQTCAIGAISTARWRCTAARHRSDPHHRAHDRRNHDAATRKTASRLRQREAIGRGAWANVHCWKDIAALNPASRKAQREIQRIAKRSGNAA